MANVTLVKPMQTQLASPSTLPEENTGPKLSLARPKIGRFPIVASEMEPEEAPINPAAERLIMTQTQGGKIRDLHDEPAYDLIGLEPTRPWDFKFALFLVTLLVVINLGLVMLLHNNHAQETVVSRHSKIAPVADEVTAPTPVAATDSIPTPVVIAPSAATVPASSASLKDLPNTATTKQAVAVVPSASMPATDAQTSPTTPAAPAVDNAAARQDLLSIISKD